MITIVFAHPWHGSFNKAILDTVTNSLDKQGREYCLIDLAKDGFNPSFEEADLALYHKGESSDPLVRKYQNFMRCSDEMIFIFPIWWGTMPADLKGFFDKVMLLNFSHNYENGWTALLNIKKAIVITTSESPTEQYRQSIEECFVRQMLLPIGIANATWLNCERVGSESDEFRQHFLEKLKQQL